ncbi:MAG: efflux RND transporter permease subunit, partial [Gammaproteobacteria bacterium]|nr:efflux RND transporter permease subunit [Gammaproteobacteria bacterium]
MNPKLGISGTIAKSFLKSEITPLLALVGLFMGLFAIMVTPREEEPQINVTIANVFIPFPGANAREVEQLVSTPAEQVLSEIKGIEHVYSVSSPGMATITVQFEVGEDYAQSMVKLYNKVFSNDDWLPANLGIGKPLIKPKGIDDVPVVSLTLWTEDDSRAGYDLQQVAHTIEAELKRVPGTRDIYTIGGPDRVVHVLLDPQRMAGYDIDLVQLKQALQAGNTSREAGSLVSDNQEISVQAGTFLSHAGDVADLVVGVVNGAPVYLRDVADVSEGPDQAEQFVWFGTGKAAADKNIEARGVFPAVTVAIAKKPGSNAIEVANQVISRFEQLKG